MSCITFYRQQRFDGGLRTGVSTDASDRLLHSFQEGSEPEEPALLWFIDVRCTGDGLPNDQEGIREWLLDHSAGIRMSITKAADDLSVGIDEDGLPFRRVMEPTSAEPRIEVAVSAIKRVHAQDMANKLRDLADHWNESVMALEPLVNA